MDGRSSRLRIRHRRHMRSSHRRPRRTPHAQVASVTYALHYLAGLELLHPLRAIVTVHALATTAAALIVYGCTPDQENA